MQLESIRSHEKRLESGALKAIDRAIAAIVSAKRHGKKIVVVTGSGPNIHEGVTTLIAELIHKGVIDGVTTSSAVVAHEMGGVLERVRRVDGKMLGLAPDLLPRGDTFEVSLMPDEQLMLLREELPIDDHLIERALALEGEEIIKAAGNMGYPLGLRTERLARDVLFLARERGVSFEQVAGPGADPRTMLGAAHARGAPMLVTVPQLVGGGTVGNAIGDSISITERTTKIAEMLGGADVIIESAVALTQEIHDGPFETHTGHGIWAGWDGAPTFSLADKTLIRIDLDPNLQKAWAFERESGQVQEAIDRGLPKTKMMEIPFRMEMSGFARLEKSIPVVADIGVVWPIIATRVVEELGVTLDFMSYPQQSPEGQAMREWIVENIMPVDRGLLGVE